MKKFYVTKHCKERYKERVLGGINIIDDILMSILKNINSGTEVTSKYSEQIPRFILYIKERYGSDKGYTLIRNGYILYIATKRKGTENLYDALTCYIDNDIIKKFQNTCLSKEDIHLKLKMLK